MLHIADRFPDAGLAAPVGARARSELYRWLSYLSYAVQTTYMHWFYPERFTTDPEGAAAIRDRASATLRRHIDWIDGELATRQWLVDGALTCADLFLFMLTRWGRFQEPPAWDSPNLRTHFDRVRATAGRPADDDGAGTRVASPYAREIGLVGPIPRIGAPRFELGTSPTRTVRATRLRHAPRQRRIIRTGASETRRHHAWRSTRRTPSTCAASGSEPRLRCRTTAGRARRS